MMRNDIAADIADAFNHDLADAVSEFIGSRFEPTGPADPISQTQPGERVTYSGRGVFGSFGIKVSEALGILRTDVKLTALQAEVSKTPKVDDDIEQNGTKYRVIHVGKDPANVTWIIQLRKV